MFDVGLNRAVAVLAEKRAGGGRGARGEGATSAALKELGPHPITGKPVRVLAGRYGPYIKHEALNANVPKGSDPAELTMEEAVGLLAAREAVGGKGKARKAPRRQTAVAKAAESCGEEAGREEARGEEKGVRPSLPFLPPLHGRRIGSRSERGGEVWIVR